MADDVDFEEIAGMCENYSGILSSELIILRLRYGVCLPRSIYDCVEGVHYFNDTLSTPFHSGRSEQSFIYLT